MSKRVADATWPNSPNKHSKNDLPTPQWNYTDRSQKFYARSRPEDDNEALWGYLETWSKKVTARDIALQLNLRIPNPRFICLRDSLRREYDLADDCNNVYAIISRRGLKLAPHRPYKPLSSLVVPKCSVPLFIDALTVLVPLQLQHIGIMTLLKLAMVCKEFHAFVDTVDFWRNLVGFGKLFRLGDDIPLGDQALLLGKPWLTAKLLLSPRKSWVQEHGVKKYGADLVAAVSALRSELMFGTNVQEMVHDAPMEDLLVRGVALTEKKSQEVRLYFMSAKPMSFKNYADLTHNALLVELANAAGFCTPRRAKLFAMRRKIAVTWGQSRTRGVMIKKMRSVPEPCYACGRSKKISSAWAETHCSVWCAASLDNLEFPCPGYKHNLECFCPKSWRDRELLVSDLYSKVEAVGQLVLPFGKHKGRTLRNVALSHERKEREYVTWLADIVAYPHLIGQAWQRDLLKKHPRVFEEALETAKMFLEYAADE